MAESFTIEEMQRAQARPRPAAGGAVKVSADGESFSIQEMQKAQKETPRAPAPAAASPDRRPQASTDAERAKMLLEAELAAPPKYGTELRAPEPDELAQEQRRRIRESLSHFLGDTPEQARHRLEGEPQPGILAPRIPLPIPRMGPQSTLPMQVVAGAANAGAGLVEGLENPALLLTAGLPKILQTLISGGFAADMASHVPGGIKRTYQAARAGDVQGATEAGVGTLGTGLLAYGAGRHAIEGVPETSPGAAVARALRQTQPSGIRPENGAPVIQPGAAPQGPEMFYVDVPDWIRKAASEARGVSIDEEARPPAPPDAGSAGDIPIGGVTEFSLKKMTSSPEPRVVEPAQVGAPSAETITGRDEGKASEMPAEQDGTPASPQGTTSKGVGTPDGLTAAPDPQPPEWDPNQKTRPERNPYRRADAERPPDIIDEISDSGWKIDPKQFEELWPDWKPRKAARKLFRRGGSPADVVMDGLIREQGLAKDWNATRLDDLKDAIDDAIILRDQFRKEFYGNEKKIEKAAKQVDQFEQKVLRGERPKKEQSNVEVVPTDNFYEGDKFTVQDHEFEITGSEYDEDGRLVSLTLDDGEKFGVQQIGPDTSAIHIDRDSLKPAKRQAEGPDFDDVPTGPASGQSGANDFFAAPESVADQTTREAREGSQAKARKDKEDIAKGQAAPITGSQGDIGQGGLFEGEHADPNADLFSGPSAERQAGPAAGESGESGALFTEAGSATGGARPGRAGAARTSSAAYPGGPLGENPVDPTSSPAHTVFPMELPEAVEFIRQLLNGKYPKVLEAVSGRRGALGSFKYGGRQADIELRADIAQLLTDADRARLRLEAEEYARVTGASAQERYEYLEAEALKEAKKHNPEIAMKVTWHEIGHLVDWLPDNMVRGRGNLFGHLAALKNYLLESLPLEPGTPHRPITPTERAQLRRDAERQVREELRPMQDMFRDIVVEEPIFGPLNITPDDIKSLFGMDARDKLPDLYRWFAGQSRAVKVEISKKAMQGIVDERAAAAGGRAQIGTRRVTRNVRDPAGLGREPTHAEIMERFRELLEAEMQRRRLVQLAAVKAELEPLIAWWRGFPEMEAYFAVPHEMYAEAFSVFANNPAAMGRRAPITYGLFQSYMEARPHVKRVYDTIQNTISAGTVMRERVMRLRESWDRDDAESVDKWDARRKTGPGDFLDNALYHHDRRFGPVFRALKKTPAFERVKEATGNFRYRAAEHELFLARMNHSVGGRLVAANLDWKTLGEYLFHRRVIMERHSIFNPLGWPPKNSLERLREMSAELGGERWGALQLAAQDFRGLYEKQVIPLMREARLWNDKLQSKIDSNVVYATFAAVRGLPDTGIQRELELSFGAAITPHIYHQIGMLGEVKNPATATVLKALSLLSAAHRNIAKRTIVEAMLQHSPTDILVAERRWSGQHYEPVIRETDRVGTIVLLQDGKVQAYYVRRDIANSVNHGPAIASRVTGKIIEGLNWQKGIFTAMNYGFWPVNFFRDTVAWWQLMPGMATPLHWFRHFPAALRAARASVHGDMANPAADAIMRRKMVVSREDPRGVRSDMGNEFDIKLASFGLEPKLWDAEAQGVGRLARIWNEYIGTGQILERLQKASGLMYLDEMYPGMHEWKKQEIVRERAGSPDFLEKGASNAQLDFFALFFNPWKQGIRATVHAARENPGQFATKLGGIVLLPTALMAAGNSGLLGDNNQKKYASIPDYDLTNYLVMPLGWIDEAQGKVAYFRFPLPDPLKLMHAAVFRILTGRGENYSAMLGGQVPGMNPLLQGLSAAGMYAMGKNPVDTHTGRTIMDDTTYKAGGWPARAELAKWSWNAFGGGILHRFKNMQNDSPAPGELEKFLAAPAVANSMGRWVKVSNRGIYDTDARKVADHEEHRAQIRQAVRTLTTRWAESGLLDGAAEAFAGRDGNGLARSIARTELSNAERVLLREPYAMEHLARTLPDTIRARQSLKNSRLQRMPNRPAKALIFEDAIK